MTKYLAVARICLGTASHIFLLKNIGSGVQVSHAKSPRLCSPARKKTLSRLFLVPEERLELSHLAIRDFESRVSTIPPLRLFYPLTTVYVTYTKKQLFSIFAVIVLHGKIERHSSYIHMSNIVGDSVFWIETEKIHPNPYQPRRDFDPAALKDLSESIRMYGVLQPLVVTRQETQKEDGGLVVEYELISGERRLRASRLAGLLTVPAIIRSDAQDARLKLELAIIENLQREDLNPVDRARSFDRLVTEFDMKHAQVALKIGKSREYVSNSLRLLGLPEYILQALSEGKITEGHARPLMMLCDRPDEQSTLFKEIVFKKLTVRETEGIARRIAVEKVRKVERKFDPEIVELENKVSQSLGTRVAIEHKQQGGKITISFFSDDDLKNLLGIITSTSVSKAEKDSAKAMAEVSAINESATPLDDRPKEEQKADEDDGELYSLKNFTV